jgi:hypothetical protein
LSYESVDKLQKLLADNVFTYATDKKKAAGRALGTFIEIITYYLIKNWNLETFAAIERPLPEFANDDITHNVEFTLHGSKKVLESEYQNSESVISSNNLRKKHPELLSKAPSKSIMLIDKNKTIRNACTLFSHEFSFYNAYINTTENKYQIYELLNRPFAMFECKRVGVEEGMKKGPQTIEKAKQGSYVARTVSSLQRIRNSDGSLGGILQKSDGDYIIEDYYQLLNRIIGSDDPSLLENFILTVGVVSNHGNWFTSENPNKELRVLAQSYDWLIFLTDKGISEFITELLISPSKKYEAVKNAFDMSYHKDKIGNVFIKVKMDNACDIALCEYFKTNNKKIELWFNIIAPKEKSISLLRAELETLSSKKWWEIYS